MGEWFALAHADGGGDGPGNRSSAYFPHREQRKPAPTSYPHLWGEWRVRGTKDMKINKKWAVCSYLKQLQNIHRATSQQEE